MAMNTQITGRVTGDSKAGDGTVTVTGNNLNVRPIEGTGESSHNRLMNPDATPAEATNRLTWSEIENVTRFRIWAYPDAETNDVAANGVAHIEADISYSFVIDSLTYAAGNLLLAEAGGAAVDVQIFKGQYNEPTEWFEGVSYFSNIQFSVPVNSKIYVEAQ